MAAAATAASATGGVSDRARSPVTAAAPTMPPRLNCAWKPDIIGRRWAFSTATAWILMPTSSSPAAMPNSASAAPSSSGVRASATAGSTRQSRPPASGSTRRAPNVATSLPLNGIVTSEPSPRHRISRPSVASSAPMRALA